MQDHVETEMPLYLNVIYNAGHEPVNGHPEWKYRHRNFSKCLGCCKRYQKTHAAVSYCLLLYYLDRAEQC